MHQRFSISIAFLLALTAAVGCRSNAEDDADAAGACCPSGEDCDTLTAIECDTAGGTPVDDASSVGDASGDASSDTETGACCLTTGDCVVVDADTCEVVAGEYSVGAVCGEIECLGDTDTLGACCLPDDICVDVSPVACSTLAGVHSVDTDCGALSCDARPVASGSCCLADGACLNTSADICEALEGELSEGGVCSEASCDSPAPPQGACCSVDGTCVEASEPECLALDGSLVANAQCAAVDCPLPTADALKQFGEQFESDLRSDFKEYYDTMSGVGREYWNLNGNDPSWTGELLGKEGAALDPEGALVGSNFSTPFRIIRRLNRMILTAQNADPPLSMEQVNSTVGFAKTLQAYCLLQVLNQQFSNGILPVEQIDAQIPENQFLGYAESLQYIDDLLGEAAVLLTSGGAQFVFDNLTTVFADFRTPATFRQFNRALAARVRIYQGDKSGSISGIAGSFFNINGDLHAGPKYEFSFERRNPMYAEPDVDLLTVHPDWLADAEAGDLRVSQNSRQYEPSDQLSVPVTHDGLTGERQYNKVKVDTMSFPLFTNGELILLYAEAQIGSDVNEVLASINRIRNAAGLGNYLGATDDASLLNEVLRQRRYLLFGLGHRWVDLRRTGKIGEINVDRPGDIVYPAFPRPADLNAALGQ